MDPLGSPFRRPPPRPTFRPSRTGFGPVPAAPLTTAARSRSVAPARRRGVPRESRARAFGLGAVAVYLVAGLTMLDAALSFASPVDAMIGLGLARWPAGSSPADWAALPFVAGFAWLGFLAQRGRFWAFAVGAAVYGLDGLIVLAAHDWVGVAIHTGVLVMMVRGLDAGHRLS